MDYSSVIMLCSTLYIFYPLLIDDMTIVWSFLALLVYKALACLSNPPGLCGWVSSYIYIYYFCDKMRPSLANLPTSLSTVLFCSIYIYLSRVPCCIIILTSPLNKLSYSDGCKCEIAYFVMWIIISSSKSMQDHIIMYDVT